MKKTLYACLVSFFFVFSVSQTGFSQEVLVKDINTKPSDFSASFCKCGNYLYFTTLTELGNELWKTDGTTDGTSIVKDINQGYASGASSSEFTCLNDKVYFFADDGIHGLELFVSDGTASGTHLIKDINPGPGPSFNTSSPAVFAGKIYFFAQQLNNNDNQLWQTDGTEAGTFLVTTILNNEYTIPWRLSSAFSSTDNYLYFRLFHLSNNNVAVSLWRSDGTDGGTVKLKEAPSIDEAVGVGNKLFFTVSSDQLWVTDGTEANTSLVSSTPQRIANFCKFNNKVIFTTNSTTWISDGTSLGTFQLTTVPANAGVVISNTFYGAGYDISTNTNFLFKTNGTIAGTTKLVDLGGTIGDIVFSRAISLIGNKLVLPLFDPAFGDEIGITDGTQSGTSMLKDIYPGTAGSSPFAFEMLNNKILFLANDGQHNRELFVTDGTSQGTHLLKDICKFTGNAVGGFPATLQKVDNHLFVWATEDENIFNGNLWRTDGTTNGTSVYYDFEEFASVYLGRNGSTLFYMAGGGGASLYKTSVENNSVLLVLNKSGVSGWGVNIGGGIALGDKFIYRFSSGGILNRGEEYWVTDGTETGTHILKDINPGESSSIIFGSTPGVLEDKLVFGADDGSTGSELWISDGSEPGTTLVKDINAGSSGSISNSFVAMNGYAYFAADDGVHGKELWRTNGTSEGTTLVKDILPGVSGSEPDNLTKLGDIILFNVYDETNGWTLWKTDGTPEGTTLVKDVIPGSAKVSFMTNFKAAGANVYFTADDNAHGKELWVTDGSVSGTYMIDITPGVVGSNPSNINEINGLAYFNAAGSLWRSDGTVKNTTKVSDLESIEIVLLNDHVYFTAFSPDYGIELFKVPFTKLDQTISFDPITSMSFSVGSFSAKATSSAGLPVEFTASTDKISISNNTVTLVKPGSVTIKASQPGNSLYSSAETTQTFCIIPLQPIISLEENGLSFPKLISSNDIGNQWFFNGAGMFGETNKTITVTTPGKYSLQVSVDGCTSVMSAEKEVIITSIGESQEELSISPNPTSNIIRVHADLRNSDSIEILDSQGSLMESVKPNGDDTEISMANFPNGMYYIKVISSNRVRFNKVVKH